MPKRTDINSILIIGSGPIVIGQACEFDYSGTQAVKALKQEGYRVILVNSNPATIMTDPELADRTYIEPILPEHVEKIIQRERPDALLPTMGGQTALNCAIQLSESGVLKKYNCQLIGAGIESIKTAEDRELFKQAMSEIGLKSAKSGLARNLAEAQKLASEINYPLILRPSRTLGGFGGSTVISADELKEKVEFALSASPNHEVLVEQSLIGWKEIELELMRDRKDNVVVICAIENIDPMGVHTGDSITVAPLQTITDKEYQVMREAGKAIMRRIGVDSGGSNVQFALNPVNGDLVVIEMNPRVSRSSALASKATGYPIAKLAAKLAIGYTLDELPNDITGTTPACFEPSIDYCVVKIPRFNFEKFPGADNRLGTQMKSVGEAMSFGRSFKEAFQKALCSMELDSNGFDRSKLFLGLDLDDVLRACQTTGPNRIWFVAEALRRGVGIEQLYSLTAIDKWFLAEINEVITIEKKLSSNTLLALDAEDLLYLKQQGFSDARIAELTNSTQTEVAKLRWQYSIKPVFKSIDTCAAEFVARTNYLYSSYDSSEDSSVSDRKKIIILGSGPNRIGQGIEFDYCCVHAVMALREDGYETIMINCNPETVSTDYDTADRLYFEPLTFENVIEIVRRENPVGVIVQFGGQTPLKLAGQLQAAGVPIIGTSVESIDLAEDREHFGKLIEKLNLRQAPYVTASSIEQAVAGAEKLGFPLMLRPSFVLGGRAMRIVYNHEELLAYFADGVEVSNSRPVLIDRYLHNAIELDLDLVSDGNDVLVAGVMEHIERAGIHSGDSSCCLPPQSLPNEIIIELERQAACIARELKVVGLMNVQFAVSPNRKIFILEVNPRASRTIPFVSKANSIPWAKVAARLMSGKSLADLSIIKPKHLKHCSIKACVFPFNRFKGVDTILGPEMKSTGEVMGIYSDFAVGFAKAQFAAGFKLPVRGTAFISVLDRDKAELMPVVRNLLDAGFRLMATKGTAKFLSEQGVEVEAINKVLEGSPHIVDALAAGKIDLVINTPEGPKPMLDSRSIRMVAAEAGVPTYTTMAAAWAGSEAIKKISSNPIPEVRALQDYHSDMLA